MCFLRAASIILIFYIIAASLSYSRSSKPNEIERESSIIAVSPKSLSLYSKTESFSMFPRINFAIHGDSDYRRRLGIVVRTWPPSPLPTSQPSSQPTGQPSRQPTRQPTGQPSRQPSRQPTAQPSRQPTAQPTSQPIGRPSAQPTRQPTVQPSRQPTVQPSGKPTGQPTGQPTNRPISRPTGLPSSVPTSEPTVRPSRQPTGQPTNRPISQPTGQPSTRPSTEPSQSPSACPSEQPPGQTFSQPWNHSSEQPYSKPSSKPSSAQPSGEPSNQPHTMLPSVQLTTQISNHSSEQPSSKPSSEPSTKPSTKPSSAPVSQPPSVNPSYHLQFPTPLPTSSPTAMIFPSSNPTFSSTVYVTPSVPKIVGMAVTPASHNASVTITLSFTQETPGTVYCIAMGKGRIPTSINFVKSGGTAEQYMTPTMPIAIVIPELLALITYEAYCYVELSDGSGSTYADVISRSQLFSTTCCRIVTILNAPSSVYGDVLQYSSTDSNNALSTYVFSYQLESAPSWGSIVITPTFTSASGAADNDTIVSVPTSQVFQTSYTGSKLKGQFYLSAASTVSGTFTISLLVTGQDRNSYTTTSTNVHILSIHQPLPAPELLSCVFDSSGGYSVILFDRLTDQAGITADSWPCEILFMFVDVDTTICSWTSLSTVKVIFVAVSATSLKPRDTLSIKGGMLRAACLPGTSCTNNYLLRSHEMKTDFIHDSHIKYSRLASSLSVVVEGPIIPVAPLIIVILPTIIGSCNNLLIDLSASTGSGGRPWTSVLWTIVAENGETNVLTDFFTNNFDFSSSFIVIPASMLTRTTYSIGITVTNFLGDSASSSSIVTMSGDPNLPVVSILGSVTRTMKTLDRLILKGSAKPSSCGLSYSLNHTWTLTNSSGVLLTSKSISTDPTMYIAPAYTFVVGSSYIVTLNVLSLSSQGRPLSSASTFVKVYIAHGNVLAAVRGGYMREVSIDRALTLDASISSDEDTSTGSSGLLFSWTCTIVTLTDFGSICTFGNMSAILSTSSVLSLPANQMTLSKKYSFLVTVKSKDGRSASRNVLITPLLPGAPIIYSSNTLTKFNQDDSILIPASITANTSMVVIWTAYYNGLAVSLDKAYTKLTKEFTAKEMQATGNYPLAVLPNAFVAGRTYTFRLTAHPFGNTALVAKTDVVLIVNSPPIGGRTSVSPQHGSALATDFTITSTGWSDDLSDYPLSYSFAYRVAKSPFIPALTLQVSSPIPYTVALLPPGRKTGVWNYIGFIYVLHDYSYELSYQSERID